MDTFYRAVAIVLISIILVVIVKKTNSEIGQLLSILVCGMVILAAINYLQPIMDFVHRLEQITKLDSNLIKIILKVVGVTMTAEIAELICADSGNQALGKSVQILASFVIIVIAIPLFTALLDLIEEVITRL
jgi:stage III sporulation protein AD